MRLILLIRNMYKCPKLQKSDLLGFAISHKKCLWPSLYNVCEKMNEFLKQQLYLVCLCVGGVVLLLLQCIYGL